MERIKQRVEKLNNLYFRLNGMYQGCLECIKKAGLSGKDVDYLESILNVDYIGIYLEMIDDAAVEMLGHSLECDAYQFTEKKNEFENSEVDMLNNKIHNFTNSFLIDLKEVKQGIGNVNFSDIYDDVCLSMSKLVAEIQRSVFYAVNSHSYLNNKPGVEPGSC